MEKNINFVVRAQDPTTAWDMWWDILSEQAHKGKCEPSRAGNIVGEVINAITIIEDPRKCAITSDIRRMSVNYAVGELLWYMSKSNKLSDIERYSKAWTGLSDDGVLVNSAYVHRIHTAFGFDQWDFVKEKLTADPNSRQAVIHIKDASDKPTKDTPCTVCLQFSIRDNRLYMTTYMRSNDLWLGMPYDFFAFMSFQNLLAMELGVELGTYTHIAGSLHLYEKHWKV
jgi:thymidylate synthase